MLREIMMRQLLKKVLPRWLVSKISCYLKMRYIKKGFLYDFKRYAAYTDRFDSAESLIALLALECHGLEKGFTMPDFRTGFGETRLQVIIPLCRDFIEKYGKQNDQLHLIIKVLYEYRLCHQELNAPVPDSIRKELDMLLAEFPDISSQTVQIDCTRADYFADSHAEFPHFARSRHSVRNFTDEPVSQEKIHSAIALAQCAPSACNRQPARIIVISDKEKIARIFSLHGGNRGFGHTVDKLLLVAGYLPGYHGIYERNWLYVDCGIFTMNLVYALHYYEIGTVILNWNMEKDKNNVFYDELQIPAELTVSCMIALGNVPASFKVCTSPKKQLNDIILEI